MKVIKDRRAALKQKDSEIALNNNEEKDDLRPQSIFPR